MEGKFIGCVLRFECNKYSYYIADTPLGEEAILGENHPPSTAATGLGVGISATGKEVFNIIKIHAHKILVVISNKISHQRQGHRV